MCPVMNSQGRTLEALGNAAWSFRLEAGRPIGRPLGHEEWNYIDGLLPAEVENTWAELVSKELKT